ncbi:YrdB family protein [Microbacterium sp. ZW T5_56]|uniref:YrdB family protein n=1 Tax=Microbacterium sp. ZW T5_56 TaxID=3378081 RepID=UPI003851DC36
MTEDPAGWVRGGSARRVALIVRFVMELALLIGAFAAAWRLTTGGWQWASGIAAVVVVAVVWALFLSPKAEYPLPEAARLAIETALVSAVAILLSVGGLTAVAVIGFLIWLADRIAVSVLDPHRGRRPTHHR